MSTIIKLSMTILREKSPEADYILTKPLSLMAIRVYGKWSGKPGSNRRPVPWQGTALPTELFPQKPRIWQRIKMASRRGVEPLLPP